MAYVDQIQVDCKNKGCDKKVTIYRLNGVTPDPLPACPNCGFKTLSMFHPSHEMLEELTAKLVKMNDQ